MRLICLNIADGPSLTHPADLATVLARHFPWVCAEPEEWARAFDSDLDGRLVLSGIVQDAQNRGLDRVSTGGPADGSAALLVTGGAGLCLVIRQETGEAPTCTVDLVIEDDEVALALGADLIHLAAQRSGMPSNLLRWRRAGRLLESQ
jgi:hypothetical protein